MEGVCKPTDEEQLMGLGNRLRCAISVISIILVAGCFLLDSNPVMEVFIDGFYSDSGGTYSFGQVAVGTSAEVTVSITNQGQGDLNIESVSTTASNSGGNEFVITREPNYTVVASNTTTFVVSFSPQGNIQINAELLIRSNDFYVPVYRVTISGTGTSGSGAGGGSEPNIEISVGGPVLQQNTTVTFADTDVGQSTDKTITVRNGGSGDLTITGAVAVAGTHSGDFSAGTVSPTVLVPDSYAYFTLTFAPSVEGARAATITIQSDDPDEPNFALNVNGNGVVATNVPEINIRDTSFNNLLSGTGIFDFGSLSIGANADRTIVVENLGNGDLAVTVPLVISGTNSSQFLLVSQPAATIAASIGSGFSVRFSPTGMGVQTATLTVNSDDADEAAYTITLQGTGAGSPDINLKQATSDIANGSLGYTFGSTMVEFSSTEVVFTVENIGNQPLNLTGSPEVTITGTDAADFAVSTAVPSNSIAVSSSTAFGITFSPASTAGAKTATVTIASNDPDTASYTFAINATSAPSNNADLSYLGGFEASGVLSPTFSAAVTSYTSTVPYDRMTLSVTATAVQAGATVVIKKDATVISGAVPIAVGVNSFSVEVDAQDGTTQKVYYLDVTKRPWTRVYPSGSENRFHDLAIDSGGLIAIAGYAEGQFRGTSVTGGSNKDFLFMKHTDEAAVSFELLDGVSNDDAALSIAIDSLDNTYIGGYTKGSLHGETLSGGLDAFVAKYNSAGVRQWTRLIGGVGTDSVYEVAVYETGGNIYVYVAGTTRADLNETNAGLSDIFIAKYTDAGTQIWIHLLGGDNYDFLEGLAVDQSTGAAYITGFTASTSFNGIARVGTWDAYIAKYDSDGALAWRSLTGNGGLQVQGFDVSMDSTNANVYALGYTNGSVNGATYNGDGDIMLLKYNTAGVLQSTNLIGESGGDSGSGMKVDATGNLFITGSSSSHLNGVTNPDTLSGSAFLIKLNSAEVIQWVSYIYGADA